MAEGRLVALRWAERPLEMVTQIVWHKDKWLSPVLRAFIDVTHEVMEAIYRDAFSRINVTDAR
jgi:DNA-binding transcriptional LysR family regulator